MNPFLLSERALKQAKVNIFGEPEEEAERYVPAPCVSILITDEIRQQDAAAQEARSQTIASAWAIKPTLLEDNLRTVRRPVADGRGEGHRIVVVKPKPTRKLPVTSTPKPVRQPKPAAQPQPPAFRRKRMPKSIVTYKPLPAISVDKVPASRTGRGAESPYSGLYKQISEMESGIALPLQFKEKKDGYSVGTALRKLSKRDSKILKQRTSDDGLIFYFWLTPLEEKAA